MTDEQQGMTVAFLKRIRKEATDTLNSSRDGVCIITCHVLMDASGTPRMWVVREGLRIEPSSTAAVELLDILSGVS